MPTTEQKRRDRENKRNHILDVAERLFSSESIDGVTIDRLAAEAGVAKGTIYLYFKTKEDVIFGVVDRNLQQVFQGFGEALADASDGLDLVRRMLECEQRVMFSDNYDLRRIFVQKMTSVHSIKPSPGFEAHVKLVSRIKSAWMHAIETGQKDGSIRSDYPAVTLGTHMWGVMIGSFVVRLNVSRRNVSQQNMVGPKFEPLDVASDAVTLQLLLDALRPAAANRGGDS